MALDAKIYVVINDMDQADLEAVILSAGHALPTHDTGVDEFVEIKAYVVKLYEDGDVSSADILAEYHGGL